MNSAISKLHPNIFKLIDLLKEHEQLASISFEKSNLGLVKSRRTKEYLKNKEIEILKLKYETGIIDSMDFLMAVISFVKDFD